VAEANGSKGLDVTHAAAVLDPSIGQESAGMLGGSLDDAVMAALEDIDEEEVHEVCIVLRRRNGTTRVSFDFNISTDSPEAIAEEMRQSTIVPKGYPSEHLKRDIDKAIIARCEQIRGQRRLASVQPPHDNASQAPPPLRQRDSTWDVSRALSVRAGWPEARPAAARHGEPEPELPRLGCKKTAVAEGGWPEMPSKLCKRGRLS
jgi:hypothetical protein